MKEEQEKEMEMLKEEINKLKHLLIGIDGTNGMRQDMKDLKHDMGSLKAQIHEIGKTLSMYAGGGLAILAAFEILSLFIKQ